MSEPERVRPIRPRTTHDVSVASNPNPLDGVTTGFSGPSETELRSMVDRLGKAARKASQGQDAAAWLMVGRIQSELAAFCTKRGDK